MRPKSTPEDALRTHWLGLPARAHLSDQTPDLPPVTIELRTGDRPLVIETVDGAVTTRPGSAERPDLILSGPPELTVAVLMGRLELAQARARGALGGRP